MHAMSSSSAFAFAVGLIASDSCCASYDFLTTPAHPHSFLAWVLQNNGKSILFITQCVPTQVSTNAIIDMCIKLGKVCGY